MLATSMDAVVVMRSDGTVAEWSDEAARVFGWDRADVLDQEMAQFIVPAHFRERHHAGLRHYLTSGEGPVLRTRIEITALRRSGEEFPIELSISPVRLGSEEVFLAFIRDVSSSKATMEALERRAHEAALLHRVASVAAESGSLDDVIQLCLESICDLLGWPIGHAFLARPESEHLSDHFWTGDVLDYGNLREATKRTRFPRGYGLPGRVWAGTKSEWIDDADMAQKFVRGDSRDLGIGAAFAIPITARGQVVAVLEFFSPVPMRKEPDRVLVAETIAAQAGRALERERDRQHQLLLLGELDHRTKNLLAVVSSMAALTARDAVSVKSYTQDFTQRLTSLSASHSLLTKSQWGATDIRELINDVVGVHLSRQSPQLQIEGCELYVEAKTALSLGLIFHELATNAVKYGALGKPNGTITITCEALSEPSSLTRIAWREMGVGPCRKPERTGFGTKLIQTSARHDLGGNVEVTYSDDGMIYEIVFPAA
ncbi:MULTISPECIES: sensor histidine kinase [unclassified Brevundimonas]|uniref:sensor histidine kinase n=1 Tax=unclassified Brevundimonas TaxID=2622653 RepID=UPI0006F2101E|nr:MULTISPECIES: HWE histidine kinase domain-containing protein [unclassified Brevundimonas]KQY87902.1 hypothetical protein ASD25_21470 [Brevundimonas sp. Root1423]KRA22910.1 hypothetical protein ASD59_09835 [Brevundimonas sp. Root608]